MPFTTLSSVRFRSKFLNSKAVDILRVIFVCQLSVSIIAFLCVHSLYRVLILLMRREQRVFKPLTWGVYTVHRLVLLSSRFGITR